MRKACIELIKTLNIAVLLAGDLGGGRCLHKIQMPENASAADWRKAFNECQQMAVTLKYEVSRIRGQSLADLE